MARRKALSRYSFNCGLESVMKGKRSVPIAFALAGALIAVQFAHAERGDRPRRGKRGGKQRLEGQRPEGPKRGRRVRRGDSTASRSSTSGPIPVNGSISPLNNAAQTSSTSIATTLLSGARESATPSIRITPTPATPTSPACATSPSIPNKHLLYQAVVQYIPIPGDCARTPSLDGVGSIVNRVCRALASSRWLCRLRRATCSQSAAVRAGHPAESGWRGHRTPA